MPRLGPDLPPPEEMTVAELEAAFAVLPSKRDALREAFDRLSACSPSPLPFPWGDLEAHISSLHSSISLRFRQVGALEAARPAPAAAAPAETRGGGTGENEFHAAARCSPDAAALALHAVELFLHNKMLKTNKTWVNCVGLIRMLPVVVTKPSADTIEQAKRVAKDWKEMIDNPGSCMVLCSLASWGLLYFLISYNIVSEFETKEIFCLFGTIPRKQQKMNYAMLFKGLGLFIFSAELMDYLIGNGQQIDALYFARVFNLVDKYPPVSLLKGYVEKAKQTAVEISQKNVTHQSLVCARNRLSSRIQSAVIIKELENLRRAHDLAKQQITDSSLRTSIGAEINALLGEFGKRKRSLSNSSTASTSNSQQQHTESNKKHKKEQEHHEEQESQQQGKQSKSGEKLEKKQDKPQQKQQQQKQEDK
ncbi:hypothetical protein BAE44_0010741, partial [Dichanthelium oligosanthes]